MAPFRAGSAWYSVWSRFSLDACVVIGLPATQLFRSTALWAPSFGGELFGRTPWPRVISKRLIGIFAICNLRSVGGMTQVRCLATGGPERSRHVPLGKSRYRAVFCRAKHVRAQRLLAGILTAPVCIPRSALQIFFWRWAGRTHLRPKSVAFGGARSQL